MDQRIKSNAEITLEELGLRYSQHEGGFIIEILNDYPSLIEELKTFEGVDCINIGSEYGITKPKLKQHLNFVTIFINA